MSYVATCVALKIARAQRKRLLTLLLHVLPDVWVRLERFGGVREVAKQIRMC